MKTLTEYELRAMCLPSDTVEYAVERGVFVTPLAREYLRDRGIELVVREPSAVMPQTPMGKAGARYRILTTGEATNQKPEEMTHLYGNVLVPKNHPRILFRGKLDSLEAKIMESQTVAVEDGYPQVATQLEEFFRLTQCILGAEVKGTVLPDITLMGMDSARLRHYSHHIKEELGIDHPVPHYSMGKLCVTLNSLRTAVRETELAAVSAFCEEGVQQRGDLVEALNRMSSGVYIILCRKLAGQYTREKGADSHG